jgi:hypothetical protein
VKAIEKKDTMFDAAAEVFGTAMMLAWTMWLGIGGLVFLLGCFYAVMTQSPRLLIVSLALMSVPLVLTLVWGFFGLAHVIAEKYSLATNAESQCWWERRKGYRVLYQAYYH